MADERHSDIRYTVKTTADTKGLKDYTAASKEAQQATQQTSGELDKAGRAAADLNVKKSTLIRTVKALKHELSTIPGVGYAIYALRNPFILLGAAMGVVAAAATKMAKAIAEAMAPIDTKVTDRVIGNWERVAKTLKENEEATKTVIEETNRAFERRLTLLKQQIEFEAALAKAQGREPGERVGIAELGTIHEAIRYQKGLITAAEKQMASGPQLLAMEKTAREREQKLTEKREQMQKVFQLEQDIETARQKVPGYDVAALGRLRKETGLGPLTSDPDVLRAARAMAQQRRITGMAELTQAQAAADTARAPLGGVPIGQMPAFVRAEFDRANKVRQDAEAKIAEYERKREDIMRERDQQNALQRAKTGAVIPTPSGGFRPMNSVESYYGSAQSSRIRELNTVNMRLREVSSELTRSVGDERQVWLGLFQQLTTRYKELESQLKAIRAKL